MQTQEVFGLKNYTDIESLRTNAHLCTLFIHVSSQNISFTIGSNNHNAIYSLKIIELNSGDIFKMNLSELKTIFNSFQLSEFEFANTKIIIESKIYAIVPDALFVAENAASFLKLNAPLLSDDEILFNHIKKNKVCIFALNHVFLSSIKNIFPQADIIHEAEQILNIISSLKENADTLFVYVSKNYIQIIQFKTNDLYYFNLFSVEADTDIIYFILSVAELLKINSEKMTVKLFGNISNNSSLTGLMKKYILQIELMKRPEQFSYPASFREFQEQQNYLQTNSLFCVS